jgi:peptidyl-prolyl cis-trans isomerase C
MIARPLRRVALVLALVAGAMALSSCASTLNDAATITYTDQTGKHTAHISRADLVSDVRDLVAHKDIRDGLATQYKAGDGSESTDTGITAEWLTELIHQKVFEAAFEAQHLKLSEADRTNAENEIKQGQSLLSKDFTKFSKPFQRKLVENQARIDVLLKGGTCPSDKLVAHVMFSTKADAENALATIKRDQKQFGAIARSGSLDTNAKSTSGMLGCLAPGVFPPQFEKAANDAPLGVTTGPVQAEGGYHLIYVTKWDPSLAKTFEQNLQQVAQAEINSRVAKLKVKLARRFGTWELVTDPQSGSQSFAVVAPKAPAPRAQREKS